MLSKRFLGLALLAACAGTAFAQAPQPLPNPDLSRLSPADGALVREARADFDKMSSGQSGVALAEAYGNLGAAYSRVQLLDAAAIAFDNAARVAPLDDRWVYLRGVVARMQGKPAEARAAFERAIKLNGLYLPTRIALAAEMMRAGDLQDADRLLTSALADHEKDPALRATLGDIAFRQKRNADAIAYINEAIRLDPKATSLYAALARVQQAAGNAEAARAAQAKAGDIPPRLEDALLQRLLPPAGTVAAAPAAPAAAPPPDARQLAVGEANFQAAAGNFDAARTILDKALAKQPSDAVLLANYARLEAMAGRFDAARTRADAAIKADPKLAMPQMVRALVLEMAGDDAGAKAAYERAAATEPKAPRPQVALGNLALRSGRAADAVVAYRAATVLAPDDPADWARLLAAESVAGQCATGVREAAANAAKHARDPLFAELHVRAVSACPQATPAQKQAVLAVAETLYKGSANIAQASETYALALAANGKWKDAEQTQGAALYEAARAGDQSAVAEYREFYQHFQKKQMPAHPWPDSHELIKPPRPQRNEVPAKSPAPAK